MKQKISKFMGFLLYLFIVALGVGAIAMFYHVNKLNKADELKRFTVTTENGKIY